MALVYTDLTSADLEIAIGTGCKTLFHEHISLSAHHGPSNPESIRSISRAMDPVLTEVLLDFIGNMDLRLRAVWWDIFEFVRAVNIAKQCKRKVDSDIYLDLMISIHYRLVNIQYDLDDVHESLRLGLLAFASTLFLQWRDFKTRFEHLAQRLRSALEHLDNGDKRMPDCLSLWLHIIGPVCVLNDSETIELRPALGGYLRRLRLPSWSEVKLHMNSILWVDFLHDERGETTVKSAISSFDCVQEPPINGRPSLMF